MREVSLCLIVILQLANAWFIQLPQMHVRKLCVAGLTACSLLGGGGGGSVQSAVAAAASETKTTRQLMDEGSASFANGEVDRSVKAFRAAAQLDPRMSPYLWQKGIAEYAAGEYDACAAQFRADLTIPSHAADTEESLFFLACEAKRGNAGSGQSAAAAYQRALESLPIPPSRRVPDRRAVMNAAYDVWVLGKQPSALTPLPGSTMTRQQIFYSLFYQGLYYEAAEGDAMRARELYREALGTPYASSGSGDFMVTVAKVFSAR